MSNESPRESTSSCSQYISLSAMLTTQRHREKRIGSNHDAFINYHNYAAYIKMKLVPKMGQQVKDDVLYYMRGSESMSIWREDHTLNLNSMMSPSLTT